MSYTVGPNSDRLPVGCNLEAMAKSEQLTLRLAPDVKAALQRIASAEDRSLSYIVDRILREYLEREAVVAESKRSRK